MNNNVTCVITCSNEKMNLKVFLAATKIPKEKLLVIGNSKAIKEFAIKNDLIVSYAKLSSQVPKNALVLNAVI